MREIFLLGVGHNTSVFIDLAEHCGYRIKGLYHYNDEKSGELLHGIPILGSFEKLFYEMDLSGRNFLLTMGDNLIRSEIADKLRSRGGQTPFLIHPTAVISRFANIQEGVSVSPFSYVQANSTIGRDTIILSGVNISHDNTIGKGCFIAGGATIGAYTVLEDFVFIGQGVLTVSEKVKYIGKNSLVGAGALVTKPIEPNIVVAGRPAKPFVNKNVN